MEQAKKRLFQVDVNSSLCKECGYCKEVCPSKVFETSGILNTSGYQYMIAKHSEKCIGCLKCLMICPDFAISVESLPEK